MRKLVLLLLCSLVFQSAAAVVPAVETAIPGEPPGPAYVPLARPAPPVAGLIDERTQLITHPGAGAGGADESRLQNVSLGMLTQGYSVNNAANIRLADDFVIPAGGYTVTAFTVYAYQTGSTTTSTFNDMVFRIWNGAPNLGTSTVVFGDITTSRLTSTAFTNIFRVQENTSGATNRPIMAITASGLSIPLTAGTYWIEFGLRGTLASGPFAPAKSILGQVNTGNALQYNMIGWTATLTDAGGTQGIPLTIDGNPGTDLVTTLTDTPDPVAAGASVTYTATVNNAGPNDATDVAIALPLAIGTTFVSASASAGGTCTTPAVGATGTVTCTWSGITAAAVSRSVSVVAAVPANSASGSVLSVTATATSLANELNPANNAATTTTTVAIAADLSLTLTDAPDPVTTGTQLTYVATLTNNGPSDAPNATISLPLPTGASLVSATPDNAGTCNAASPVVCSWSGPIAPAVTRAATIIVTIAPAQIAALSATATASLTPAGADPNAANNSATATTAIAVSADLSLTLTDAPDPVTAGTQLTYVATLTNNGPSDAPNATITLPLPAGTSLVSATPDNAGTCNATGPVVCSWSGPIAPTATRAATIIVTVAPAQIAALSATATASLTPAGADPNAANNSATATTAIAVSADLSLTLTDAPDPVTAGTNLSYIVTVTNPGPSDATAVVVSLPTPVGTSLVSGTVSGGGTCAAGISCAVTGSIAPGASRTLTITVRVAAAVLDGTVINASATVTAGSPDPVGANNSASTTTAVVTAADLVIGLASTATEVLPNVPVTFTATSVNNGPSDAQNLSITVTLTPGFRYSSLTATGATCTTPQVGNSGAIVCTWAGATAPGVIRTLSVVAFSNVEGATVVNASTTSATPDSVPNNNASSVTVQVGYAFEAIPTLNHVAMVLLGLMLSLAGFVALRRQA